MFASGLILSMTLMGLSWWLHRSEQMGWPNESHDPEADGAYLATRRRTRRFVNGLFFLCGLLILVATFATPDQRWVWMACWLLVVVGLTLSVALALLDMFRTMRHYRKRYRNLRDGD
ncbi:MAG: hypothetical protein AAGD07_13460 [Planctomycetota bacterium]